MPLDSPAPRPEALLCSILRHFETLALRQYEAVAPELANGKKRALLSALQRLAPDDEALDGAELGELVARLALSVTSRDRRKVLLRQAFLLEIVGQAIYASAGRSGNASDDVRAACALGIAAGEETRKAAFARIADEFEDADTLLASLVEAASGVIMALGPFGGAIDREFGESLGLNFGDLMAESMMTIDAAAARLGVDRSKLAAYLMNVMMEA